jgi:YesN/AraC family two-component response regulator
MSPIMNAEKKHGREPGKGSINSLVIKVVHESPSVIPIHSHDVHQLFYVIKGRGILHLLGKKFTIQKGDLVIILEKEAHEIIDDKNDFISQYSVYFQEEKIVRENRSLCDFIRSIDPARRIFPTGNSPYLIRIPIFLREILYEETHWDNDSAFIQKIKILEILLNVKKYIHHIEHDDRTNRRLSQTERNILGTISYLENNYYREFSLSEVAAMSSVGKRQFDRIFKYLTGANFIEYLNRIRIEQAKKLLVSGGKGVISICFDVGFNDLSYFYRTFKKFTGCTPKEFIKTAAFDGKDE